VEDLLAQLHLDGETVGVLQNFVHEAHVFRDETVVFERQRLSFAGQIVKQTIFLSSLNSLFYDLVEEIHEHIVPGLKGGAMRWFVLSVAVLVPVMTLSLNGQNHPSKAVEVMFDDWTVPTPNSGPHDPAFGPGNTLWYTGQASNKLGRVDMSTGEFREFDLPQGHGPHGLIADNDGNIWYTANTAAAIAKLDPKTGKVTEYKMPDAAARDP